MLPKTFQFTCSSEKDDRGVLTGSIFFTTGPTDATEDELLYELTRRLAPDFNHAEIERLKHTMAEIATTATNCINHK